jgi:hypothetical protein
MKTSEKLKSVLCDPDGNPCVGTLGEQVMIKQAIEEVEVMESRLEPSQDLGCDEGVVLKYELSMHETTKLNMPKGAKVLSFQMQDGAPRVWAMATRTYRATEGVARTFYRVGTGVRFDPRGKTYVGTAQHHGLVWHLFEVTHE